jgi:hypothetical protein
MRVAKDAKPNTMINTGPIGTGDFKNDPKVVYVMQHLAAQQIGGITMRYWALNSQQQQDFDAMVTKIINNWKNDKDKSMTHLMVLAQRCLTSSPKCT